MEPMSAGRRAFLQTTLVGAAAAATGSLFTASAAPAMMPPTAAKGIFVCSVCGHVEFGGAPDECPVCRSPKEKFGQNDKLFTDAEAKDPTLGTGHTPVIGTLKQSLLIPEQMCKSASVRVGKKIHPTDAGRELHREPGFSPAATRGRRHQCESDCCRQ